MSHKEDKYTATKMFTTRTKTVSLHCVKCVRIRRFSVPNTGKHGPEKRRILTLFM